MKCCYCQTENQQDVEHCTFCNAPAGFSRPKQKSFLAIDHAEKPFQELIQYHTYDLLVLLRLVRAERTTAYDMMISIQRLLRSAPEGSQNDSDGEGVVRQVESDYKRYTARVRVIEGILTDRMGYKPKRIDDKLLNALQAKIQTLKI